jgi:uncharacterized protein
MTNLTDETVIKHTQNWIANIVIGCNFCPFAANAFLKNKIHYQVLHTTSLEKTLEIMLDACAFLTENSEIETTLLVLPTTFQDFDAYLELANMAEGVLEASSYVGEFQVASFHPDYLFAGAPINDPANYTNRSPYPMLHLLRGESVEYAVNTHPNASSIPDVNIAFAQKKGLDYMQKLRESCFLKS